MRNAKIGIAITAGIIAAYLAAKVLLWFGALVLLLTAGLVGVSLVRQHKPAPVKHQTESYHCTVAAWSGKSDFYSGERELL